MLLYGKPAQIQAGLKSDYVLYFDGIYIGDINRGPGGIIGTVRTRDGAKIHSAIYPGSIDAARDMVIQAAHAGIVPAISGAALDVEYGYNYQ